MSNDGKDIVLLARHMPSESNSTSRLSASLIAAYGPLMGRRDLVKALGFNSPQAFDRAVQRGHLTLRLSRIEGRRGVFALSDDVADYLTQALEKGRLTPHNKERRRQQKPAT